MPGFSALLEAVTEAYRDRRDEVEHNAAQVAEVISAGIAPNGQGSELHSSLLDEAVDGLKRLHDPVEGGFGGAPKFPQALALEFLLRSGGRTRDPELMAIGGKALV